MKLLLDEMYPPEVAVQLRRHGYDVVAVQEDDDLRGLLDPELLAFAQTERRAMVTENASHFLGLDRLYRQQGQAHHGIILTSHRRFDRRGPRGVSQLFLALEALLRTEVGWPGGESPVHWLR